MEKWKNFIFWLFCPLPPACGHVFQEWLLDLKNYLANKRLMNVDEC